MNEQLSEKGKDLVKYMPQAVNALADRLIEKLTERVLYGEKPQTNADRIRSMSDAEIADFLCDIGECDRRCPAKIGDCIFSDSTCRSAWLDWLEQEVKDD